MYAIIKRYFAIKALHEAHIYPVCCVRYESVKDTHTHLLAPTEGIIKKSYVALHILSGAMSFSFATANVGRSERQKLFH